MKIKSKQDNIKVKWRNIELVFDGEPVDVNDEELVNLLLKNENFEEVKDNESDKRRRK